MCSTFLSLTFRTFYKIWQFYVRKLYIKKIELRHHIIVPHFGGKYFFNHVILEKSSSINFGKNYPTMDYVKRAIDLKFH
jgi:hypothetical protein